MIIIIAINLSSMSNPTGDLLPSSLTEVNTRLHIFETIFCQKFYRKKSRSNFTTFQAKVFNKLREDDSTVFAQSDKGLDQWQLNCTLNTSQMA